MAWRITALTVLGVFCGAAAGMDYLAMGTEAVSAAQIAQAVAFGAAAFAAALVLLHAITRWALRRFAVPDETQRRFLAYDVFTALVWLALFAGAWGVQFITPVISCVIVAWVLLKATALYLAMTKNQRRTAFSSLRWLAFLFLISGMAALIYQIVWQRVLFAAFGVNIESITIIVSLFMFGLGVGSMVGGWLSNRFPQSGPVLFLAAELGIGAFGIASLSLIAAVSEATIHRSLPVISLAIYGLLCLPTMLMGATLPILVGHLNRYYHNVGKSVGILYCINTLGSAIACFLTADLLFVFFGQQAAVLAAAAFNILVGILVSVYARRIATSPPAPATPCETGVQHA